MNSLPLNEKIDAAVRQYAQDIVEEVKNLNIDAEVETEYIEGTNQENTESAACALLITDLGGVVIWPDFIENSASATIFLSGNLERMIKEGFTESQIDSECPMFSALLPHKDENVELLAHYLTHKIDPSKIPYHAKEW